MASITLFNLNMFVIRALSIKNKVMVIGGIICPDNCKKEIFKKIRELKTEYNIKPTTEIKWTKVSKSKENFYIALANYFFENKKRKTLYISMVAVIAIISQLIFTII